MTKFAIESYLWVIVWFDSSELYVMVKDYNHLVLRDKIQSHPRSVYWMYYVIHKTELSQCMPQDPINDFLKSQIIVSPHNFGEQVLSILSTKIMAAIFDCNGSRRQGRERNLY